MTESTEHIIQLWVDLLPLEGGFEVSVAIGLDDQKVRLRIGVLKSKHDAMIGARDFLLGLLPPINRTIKKLGNAAGGKYGHD